jgi:glycosyltransferase involved in cell wall biosynthesis
VQYHNVTPRSEFFGWDTGVSLAVAWGRRQMSSLSRYAAIGLAISEFNARELRREGYQRIAISPPLIRELTVAPHRRSYRSERHEALFVGRLAPNKAHEELLRTLALYNSTFEPRLHLTLVGSAIVGSYVEGLHSLVESLGLVGDVTFRSGLSRNELAEAYRNAHIFVSASRHEGFGFPFIEAMRTGLPVAAAEGSAVGETIGDAGLVYARDDPVTAATAWSIILHDSSFRSALVARGRRRAHHFDLEVTSSLNLAALAHVLDVPGIEPADLWYDASAKVDTWR